MSSIILRVESAIRKKIKEFPGNDPYTYQYQAFVKSNKAVSSFNLIYVTVNGDRISRKQRHKHKKYRRYHIELAQRTMDKGFPFTVKVFNERLTSIMFFQTETAKKQFLKNEPKPGEYGILFGYPSFAINDFKSEKYKNNDSSRMFVLIKPLGMFFGILRSSMPELKDYINEHNLREKDIRIYYPVIFEKELFFRIKRYKNLSANRTMPTSFWRSSK